MPWFLLKDQELDEWGISRRVAIAYLVLPLVGAVAVALTRFWYPLFHALTGEDRIFEWAQFGCWVVAFVASSAMSIRLFRNHRRGVAFLWAVLALGMFLIAGEEIAWGQRLLRLETPGLLKRVNRQREITVHNIGNLGFAFDAIFITAGLYGCITAAWYRHLRPPRNFDLVDLLVPPLFMASLFLAVPLYKSIRAVLWVAGVPSFIDYAEYIELCLAFGLASFTFLSLRRQWMRGAKLQPAGSIRNPRYGKFSSHSGSRS